MEKASTTKRLSVILRLNLTHYEKDITINKSQIDTQRIYYSKDIPQLSYRIASWNSSNYLYFIPQQGKYLS